MQKLKKKKKMQKTDWYFQNSKCLNRYLHRFEIKEENETAVLEVCEVCRTRKVFPVLDGQINANHYMSYHCRLALQPDHPLYEREYSYNPLNDDAITSPYA